MFQSKNNDRQKQHHKEYAILRKKGCNRKDCKPFYIESVIFSIITSLPQF